MIDEREGDSHGPRGGLELTEAVIGTAREPMMVLDARLRVLTANPPFYRTFGVDPGQVVGRLLFDPDGGRWDDPRLRTLLEELLHDGRTIRNLEVEPACAGGGRRRMRMRINAGRIWREDEHSELILLAVEVLDGRERPADAPPGGPGGAEPAAGDEIVPLFVHELRTPITAILNAASVAARSGGVDDLRWCREIVSRQARRLAILVEDLQEADHIRRGRLTLRRERVDLDGLIRRAVEAVRPMADAKRHELAVSPTPPGLGLEADPRRLEQVLVNLLANAVKSAPPGGRVHLAAGSAHGEVTLSVRDDGEGLPPELIARVFGTDGEPCRSLASSAEALGIGLAVAKSLVELHGGRLVAVSGEPGGGGEFVVRLPAAPAPADPS